ncbi:MAG: hypothetical protein ILP10_07405 [Lachnospiraceae bacterium]|nr:hypothetical protein [Lachnospiraceae bacterium]
MFTNTTAEEIKLNILNFGDKDSAKKGKADATITIAASSSAAFSLKDKTKGINYKGNKDLKLFATSNKITKAEYTPDIVVSKTSIGKVTATVNYAVLGGNAVAVEVKSATAEDKKTFTAAETFKYSVYDKKAKKYTVTAADGSAFTGLILEDLLNQISEGAKLQVEFFVPGTSGSTGVRPSPIAKVSLKKQGKAVTVKFDEKIGALALKNGYDYAVATQKVATGAAVELSAWHTILPYNKNAASDTLTVDTADYVPAKFDKENEANNAGKFTKKKIKSILVDELAGEITGDFYVYYRKSAGVGKPASAVNTAVLFKVKAKAAAPVIKDNAVTTGATISFKLENAEGDDAAKAYEYAFVKTSDVANVDFATVKWTKFSGKAIKAAKVTKTNKYSVTGSTDKPAAQEGTLSEFTMIVRRAGVKVKTSKTGETEVVRPSAIRKITFTVDSDGNVTGFAQDPAAAAVEPEEPDPVEP